MNLTAEQVAAAEAAGCRFIPAPPEGLHRYAMQRKLFRLDGQEVLATCGGGLYETASTLDRLIAIGRARLPGPPASPDVAAPAEPRDAVMAPSLDPEPAPTPPSDPEGTQVTASAAEPATPPARRRPRTARKTPAAELLPQAAEAEVVAESPPRAPSRARKPAAKPRWATAGAERRGRTDQHWSKRAR